MEGKCSEFGGRYDKGMSKDSGLSLYEPWEADLRPDMFLGEDPLWLEAHPEWQALYPQTKRMPTWARIRTDFHYIALRYDRGLARKVLQQTPHKITNPKTGTYAIAFLADWGPHSDTNRLVDCSPGLLKFLNAKTDDVLDVVTINL